MNGWEAEVTLDRPGVSFAASNAAPTAAADLQSVVLAPLGWNAKIAAGASVNAEVRVSIKAGDVHPDIVSLTLADGTVVVCNEDKKKPAGPPAVIETRPPQTQPILVEEDEEEDKVMEVAEKPMKPEEKPEKKPEKPMKPVTPVKPANPGQVTSERGVFVPWPKKAKKKLYLFIATVL